MAASWTSRPLSPEACFFIKASGECVMEAVMFPFGTLCFSLLYLHTRQEWWDIFYWRRRVKVGNLRYGKKTQCHTMRYPDKLNLSQGSYQFHFCSWPIFLPYFFSKGEGEIFSYFLCNCSLFLKWILIFYQPSTNAEAFSFILCFLLPNFLPLELVGIIKRPLVDFFAS